MKEDKTILLVEDQTVIAFATAQGLRKAGYEVALATSGEAAVQIAHANSSIDLILMDVDLGEGMDGTQAAREILQFRNLPIVFLTAHAEREMVERVKGITRYGYIIKNSGSFVLESSIEMAFELFEAHQQTRENEERYRTLLENLPIPVFTKDRDGIYTSSNVEHQKLWGTSITGCTDAQVLPPEVAEDFRSVDLQIINTGKILTTEDQVETACSGKRYLLTRKVPLIDHHGTITGILGASLDITEQRENTSIMQSRLRLHEYARDHSLEELLRATLDEVELLTGSQIGFYHFLEDDQKTLTLHAWSTRTEREFCKAEGKGFHYNVDQAGVWVDCILKGRAVIHNDYASLPHRKGMPEGHATVTREMVVPVFRGSRIVAVLGVGNKPVGYTERDVYIVSTLADLAWDIAETKLKEDALLESERKYRLLFENMTTGFALHSMIYDEHGQPVDYRYLDVNPAFEKLTGLKANDVVGKQAREVTPDVEPLWIGMAGQVATTGLPVAYPFFGPAMRKNSSERKTTSVDKHFDTWVFSPAKDQFAVMISDATERLHTLEAISRQRDLSAALSSISDLASACSVVLSATCKIPGVECGGLYLVDEYSGDLNLVAHQDLSPAFIQQVSYYSRDSSEAQIVHNGKPLYAHHRLIQATADFSLAIESLRAIAVIPVYHEGKAIASLNLGSRVLDDFPEQVRGVLEGIAAQIGGTLARIQAETRMRESEERYQAFINQSFEGISRMEFDVPVDTSLPIEAQIDKIYENAYIAECNQALANMHHRPTAEAMMGARLRDAHGGRGIPSESFLPPVVFSPLNRAVLRKFIENGYKSINDETLEYSEDGQPVWFLSNTVGTVENGYLVRLWGTTLGITKQKLGEENLRKSEQKFRSFVQQNSEGFLLVNEQGLIIESNEAFAQIVGYSVEEIKGHPLWEMQFRALPADQATPEKYNMFKNITLQMLQSGKSPLFERPLQVMVQRKDGALIMTQQTTFPIKTEKGIQIGSVIRDITAEKRYQEKIQALNTELLTAYDATIEGWASTLELRNQETVGHSRRVVELTLVLARKMDMPEESLENIRRGAILHDIGKMGIPDAVLLKPGPLDSQEWALMRQHPAFAYHLLSRIPFLQPALDIPYCHHERWDGSGYPREMKGEEIPLPARIFSVVDVWDALTTNRTYRAAWSREEALRYIKSNAGVQFDPHVVEAFLALMLL